MEAPYQKLSIKGWPHALWAKPLKSYFFTFIPTNLVPIEPVNVTIPALYYADKISSSSK